MALGILSIIYIVIIIIAIIIQLLLYKNKSQSKNSIFIINMLFAILLSYITYTSLPTNYVDQRILAASWSVISILAIIIRLKAKQFTSLSKIMLSISILGSIVQLFL